MESKGVTLSPCPHDDESKKSTETISILVVDDDTACLAIVAAILKKFKYEVVTVKHADDALCTLRIKGGAFDLVVSDVHMPDMNGFELQQAIAQEFNNLPVVLMSADPKEGVALRGLENGAAFFIYKPVCPDDVRDLWQFAALRKPEPSQVTIHNEVEIKKDDCNEIISVSSNDSDKKSPRNEGMETFTQAGGPSQKKPKIIWTNSLHNRFLEAIRSIGLERAVPKKILEVMNVPGLTRENVASHLQKYRIFLRRVSDASYKVQYSADHKRFSSSSIGNIFTTPSSLTLNRFPYQKPGGSGQYSPAAAAGLLGQSRRLTLPNTGIKLNFTSPLMGPTTSTYNNNNNNNNSVPSNVMKTTPPSNNYSGYSSAVNLKRLTGTTTTVVEPSNANIADDAFVVGNNNNNNNRNGDQVSNFIGDYRVNQLSNSNPSLRFDNGGGLINREPTYSPMFDMFDLEALSTPRPLDQGHFHTTLADQVNMLNQAQNEGENFTNANFYGDTSLWDHNSIPSFDQPPNLQQQNFSLDLVKPQELGANNSTAQVNNTILLPTNERDDDEFLDSLLAPYGEDNSEIDCYLLLLQAFTINNSEIDCYLLRILQPYIQLTGQIYFYFVEWKFTLGERKITHVEWELTPGE